MDYDSIIVGSGISGLTTGAVLAKSGQKVLLIEKNSNLGGLAGVFSRKGCLLETAQHILPGPGLSPGLTKIYKFLGISDKLKFIKLDLFYRSLVLSSNDSHHNLISEILLSGDALELQRTLWALFYKDKLEISNFFQILKIVHYEFEIYFKHLQINSSEAIGGATVAAASNDLIKLLLPISLKYSRMSCQTCLGKLFKNPQLIALLSYPAFFSNNSLDGVSALRFLTVWAAYVYGGSYFVHGGSQAICDHLASVITAHNGTIMLNSEVTELVLENKEGRGVVVESRHPDKDQNKGQKRDTILSKRIIFNVSIPYFFEKLLPVAKILENCSSKVVTTSAAGLYIIYKNCKQKMNSANYYNVITDMTGEKQYSYSFTDYGQINSGLGTDTLNPGTITILSDYQNWVDLGENEYLEKKQKLISTYLASVIKIFPHLKDNIVFTDAYTPKTIERFTNNYRGAVYGFSGMKDQARLDSLLIKVQAEYKNIFFSSVWAGPGSGFPMAFLVGDSCAQRILRE